MLTITRTYSWTSIRKNEGQTATSEHLFAFTFSGRSSTRSRCKCGHDSACHPRSSTCRPSLISRHLRVAVCQSLVVQGEDTSSESSRLKSDVGNSWIGTRTSRLPMSQDLQAHNSSTTKPDCLTECQQRVTGHGNNGRMARNTPETKLLTRFHCIWK
jgi:hypothetical protein